jgi:putative phosphoribosyl transferase
MTTPIRVTVAGAALDADLTVPPRVVGVVLFAHGSGSSRHSPRNRAVAATLHGRRLATLLADLLTADEERVDLRTRGLRFDIDLLAGRVAGLVDRAGTHAGLAGLPVGLFGASTGAAAALVAAAARPEAVRAVVSRGGRPDLAGAALPRVRAATLLIVGGRDPDVLRLNEQARTAMTAPTELTVVPGATHLFEEAGALDEVARQAGEWFGRHLPG